MCLNVIDKRKPRATGEGYKVLIKRGTGLTTPCVKTPVTVGKWMKAVNDKHKMSQLGFHIYLRREDAKRLLEDLSGMFSVTERLYRVRYRGARLQGTGDGGWNDDARVVVADEMLVIAPGRKSRKRA